MKRTSFTVLGLIAWLAANEMFLKAAREHELAREERLIAMRRNSEAIATLAEATRMLERWQAIRGELIVDE